MQFQAQNRNTEQSSFFQASALQSSGSLGIKADFKGHELSPPSHPNLCIHNHLLVKNGELQCCGVHRISFKCSYYKPTTPFAAAVSMKESDKLDDWIMPS